MFLFVLVVLYRRTKDTKNYEYLGAVAMQSRPLFVGKASFAHFSADLTERAWRISSMLAALPKHVNIDPRLNSLTAVFPASADRCSVRRVPARPDTWMDLSGLAAKIYLWGQASLQVCIVIDLPPESMHLTRINLYCTT